MLDRLSPSDSAKAVLRYGEADFQIMVPGSHVVCAVTDQAIPLDELKYWNSERQEAYVDAEASLAAEKAAGRLD